MGTVKVDAETPALGVSVKRLLDTEGRHEIVFQTHVAQDIEVGKLHALVDKLNSVTQRQMWMAELESLKLQNEGLIRSAVRIRDDRADLLAAAEKEWYAHETRRGPWDEGKLSSQAKSAINNYDASLGKYTEGIEINKRRIKELEQCLTSPAPK